MILRICLAATLLALPAAAQTPLTAEEFEAIVLGKTIHYRQDGARAGSEQYLENRRVRWQTPDGTCDDGRWYAQGPLICFEYETIPGEPQCWSFFNEGGTLSAQFDKEPNDPPLTASRMSTIPLSCAGPEIAA